MQWTFVGEKPSRRAWDMGVTWKDGRLAAKSLFDALRVVGIDPHEQDYVNLFGDHPDCLEGDGAEMDMRLRRIRRIAPSKLVALGGKVSEALGRHGIEHRCLVHPAARGRIRAKGMYAAHVRMVLGS